MVRNIGIEDANAVQRLVSTALGHETSLSVLEKRIGELSSDSHYYIAVFEDNGVVKGFIEAEEYTLLYGDKGWNIIALAVDEAARRSGIGRSLVASLEAHAKDCGASFIRLNSRIERADAHAFYERLGYECDKVQKRFIKTMVR